MRLDTRRLIYTMCVPLGLLVSSESIAASLESAIQTALQNNPYVREQDGFVGSAEQEMDLVRRDRALQVNLSSDVGIARRDDGLTSARNSDDLKERYGAGISARWDFYDGGRFKNRLLASDKSRQATEFSREGVRSDTVMKAINAYYDVYRNRMLIEFGEEVLAEYDRLIEFMSLRVKSGDTASYELNTVHLSRSEIEFERQGFKHALFRAEEDYLLIVGERPDQLKSPNGPSKQYMQSVSEGDWEALALKQHPKVLEQHKRVEQLKAQLGEVSLDGRPTAGLEVSHRWDKGVEGIAGDRNDSSALLRVNWQLLGNNRSAQVKKANAELEAGRERLIYLKREVMRSVRLSQEFRRASKKAEVQHEKDLENIQMLLKTSTERLKHQAGTANNINSILQVLKQYQNSQKGFLQARYDKQRYGYELLYSSGGLSFVVQNLSQ